MAARDILAAVLVLCGVASVSVGGFLIAVPAGFIVLGALLLGLGVAVGFGEREEVPVEAAAAPGEADVVPSAPPAGPPTAEVAGIPIPAAPAIDTVASLSLAKYLGRTGDVAP